MREAAADSTRAEARVHLPDDRYIPIRTVDLLAALARDPAMATIAPAITEVCVSLGRALHTESRALAEHVERAYAPYNPDRETVTVGDLRGDHRALEAALDYTFDKANYDLLEDTQVRAAIDSASIHGMKVRVDPDKVGALRIYVRGRTQETRMIRTVWRPINGEMREVELYRRLAIVFRMHDSTEVSIKLFREIPVADLEALLPHAEVGMSLLDRIWIVGGGIGAIGGATWKAVALLVQGTLFASQYLWAVTVGLAGLSVRSALGYRRAKHVRSSQRLQHLYYQNIANNAGVLALLVSSIRHEELKEALLAYVMLAANPGTFTDGAALGHAIEAWIAERFHVRLVFDVADALESLDRFELWEDRQTLRTLAPSEACARLLSLWRDHATDDYHVASIARGARASA